MTVREILATFGEIPKLSPATGPRRKAPGAKRFMAKLDEPTVRKIRADAGRWPQRVLQQRYGVSRRTLYEIINRLTWAHVA